MNILTCMVTKRKRYGICHPGAKPGVSEWGGSKVEIYMPTPKEEGRRPRNEARFAEGVRSGRGHAPYPAGVPGV